MAIASYTACSVAADEAIPEECYRVLVTSYGPLRDNKPNHSWSAVLPLNNTVLAVDDDVPLPLPTPTTAPPQNFRRTSYPQDSQMDVDSPAATEGSSPPLSQPPQQEYAPASSHSHVSSSGQNGQNGHANDEPRKAPPTHIHLSTLLLPVAYSALESQVPFLHARPPSLPSDVAGWWDEAEDARLEALAAQAQMQEVEAPAVERRTAPGHGEPLAPPPEEGYDLILHIGLAGRGGIRVEKLAHRVGYRLKDANGEHAPIAPPAPKKKKQAKEVGEGESSGEGEGDNANDAGGNGAEEDEVIEELQIEELSAQDVPPGVVVPIGSHQGADGTPGEAEAIPEQPRGPVRGFGGKAYGDELNELETPVDVDRLVFDLKRSGIGEKREVYKSMDAGHHVSDFTYYCSLAEARRTAGPAALFGANAPPPSSGTPVGIPGVSQAKHTKVLSMTIPPADQPFSTNEISEVIKKIVVWISREGTRAAPR